MSERAEIVWPGGLPLAENPLVALMGPWALGTS